MTFMYRCKRCDKPIDTQVSGPVVAKSDGPYHFDCAQAMYREQNAERAKREAKAAERKAAKAQASSERAKKSPVGAPSERLCPECGCSYGNVAAGVRKCPECQVIAEPAIYRAKLASNTSNLTGSR